MEPKSYLNAVREQYENFPYPPRDPEDEKKKLVVTGADRLQAISHYCFRGREGFGRDFKALIAGGGTGDSAIFLAEQFRYTGAQVYYLDMSRTSMQVAQARARIRGLENIHWVHASILDLPELDLPEFNYINCSGVLHHLQDPSGGLVCLRDKLTPDGAMGIMVYGRYGRTAVYQLQELMRLVNANTENMQEKVENTKKMLATLPPENWFVQGKAQQSNDINSDIGIYDLFLHSQDRAYTVPQIYEWVESCDLNFVDFVSKKLFYRPEYFIKDIGIREKVSRMPRPTQQAIAELMTSLLAKHVFYCSRKTETVADINDVENIPYFYSKKDHLRIYNAVKDSLPGARVKLSFDHINLEIVLGTYAKHIFNYMNGMNNIGEIVKLIKKEMGFSGDPHVVEKGVLDELKALFGYFEIAENIFLRHKNVALFRAGDELHAPVVRMSLSGKSQKSRKGK